MSGTNRDEPKAEVIEEKLLTPSGDILLRRYRKGKFLGRGGFATCFEFTALDTHKRLAAKVVSKESIEKSRMQQKLNSEINIHSGLKHPGVVGFEHHFEDSENVYILLELCNTSTMHEVIRRRKRLSELEVQSHVLQLVEILRYLQSRKVIHRDLKLENLFLSEKMEIKLGDFGLAAKLSHEGERRRTVCGTPNFIAPEVLDEHLGHSYEADIWSLGVVIYTMLVGRPPFETIDVETTYNRIRVNNYSFPENIPLSEPSKSLISRILVTDPLKRPTLDQILQSPFLTPVYVIPRLLPVSSMVGPLSKSFVDKVMNVEEEKKIQEIPDPPMILDTAPGKAEAATPAVDVSPRPDTTPHTFPPVDIPVPPTVPDLPTSSSPIPRAVPSASPLWVVKWVDLSSKYGIGYLLSNGSVGVCFNDCSKIVVEQVSDRLAYVERIPGSKSEIIAMYHISEELPSNVSKKVTILQHFRGILSKTDAVKTTKGSSERSLIFVKKWTKTKHALLFRFSNKVIQVVFLDKSEILLSSDTAFLTYVNRQGERTNYPLEEAQVDPGSDLSKRVKFTLQMLGFMLGKSPQPAFDS